MRRRVQDYHVERGEAFDRLVIIKDRRTHRRRVPTEAKATVLMDGIKYALPQYITAEGGVMLSLSPYQTEWMLPGEWPFDIEAKISRSPLLTSSPLVETIVMKGTIFVSTYSNLSPLLSDGTTSALQVVL